MTSDSRLRLVVIALFVTAIAICAAGLWRYGYGQALHQLEKQGRADLALASDRFTGQLRRYQELAVLMAEHPTLARISAGRDAQAARALLLDAYVEGEYGGTGQRFDWQMLPENLSGHWILSGGLTPENVAEAVRIAGADAVDISSGVESAPGVKCPQKMAAFMAAVQEAQKQ